MEKMKFKAGELICREGSPGSEMYVILSGKVRIFKIINEEKIELALMGSGDFCGEIALLLGSQRTASMEAVEDTEMLILKKEGLLKKIKSDPRFALQMIMIMAKRLGEADNVISKIEGARRSLEIMYSMK